MKLTECVHDWHLDKCVADHGTEGQRRYRKLGSPEMPQWHLRAYDREDFGSGFDPIHKVIIAEWKELRHKYPGWFKEKLMVWPAVPYEPQSVDSDDDEDDRVNIGVFCFLLGYGCPFAMSVTVDWAQGGDYGGVRLKFDGRWQRLADWARYFVDPDQHVGQDIMRDWLAQTGKAFNFERLPGEIRNKVYEYALFPTSQKLVRPYHKDSTERYRGRFVSTKTKHDLRLLRVSKQLHNEAGNYFYSNAVFNFLQPGALRQFHSKSTGMTHADAIEKIKLEFTSFVDYYELFGANINRRVCSVAPSARAVWLSNLPNLRGLNIVVPPFRYLYHGQDSKVLFRGDEPWVDKPNNNGCQAVAVKALVDCVSPVLGSKVGRVTLSGDVKENQPGELQRQLTSGEVSHKHARVAGCNQDELKKARSALPPPFWSRFCLCKVQCLLNAVWDDVGDDGDVLDASSGLSL